MSQAAWMAGERVNDQAASRRRRLPHRVQDDNGTWLVPVEDLVAAGLHLNRPEPPQGHGPGQS